MNATLMNEHYISLAELKQLERLLESNDTINLQLGMALLAGFSVDEKGASWLWDYYQQLLKQEQQTKSTWSFAQIYTTGTLDSQPSKSSHVLTALLTQAPPAFQHAILQAFIKNQELTLPRNELETLPPSIFKLTDIQYLTFPYGNLKQITANIQQLTNLKVLDLRHQPLTFIHPTIAQLPQLEELWVRNAAFISDEVREIPHLDIYVEGAY